MSSDPLPGDDQFTAAITHNHAQKPFQPHRIFLMKQYHFNPNPDLLSNLSSLSHFNWYPTKKTGSPRNQNRDPSHTDPLTTHAKPHCDAARPAFPYVDRPCVDDVAWFRPIFCCMVLYGVRVVVLELMSVPVCSDLISPNFSTTWKGSFKDNIWKIGTSRHYSIKIDTSLEAIPFKIDTLRRLFQM